MQITYLIDNLLRAGTQTALGYLVQGLAARGHTQEVFCLNRRFDPEVTVNLEAAGARVVVLGKGRLLSVIGLYPLWRSLRQADVLQTFLPASDLVGRTLGKLAGVPRIVTSIRARNIDKQAWQLRLDRRTMPWADRVIFNARPVVDFSIRHEGVQPRQVVVIPNGVRFHAPSGQGWEAFEDMVPAGVPVIGSVGRLRPQKAHSVLIDALDRIRDRTNAHLLLIGDGELREILETQVRSRGLTDRVHFLGTRADLPDLFAQMDVYAHPAVFEGMPNAVMEAMAAGLPVVATDVDGTRELIRDGETGWLVPPEHPGALAEALLAALNDQAAARRIGTAAAEWMRTHYTVEKMVAGFEQVYLGTKPSGE